MSMSNSTRAERWFCETKHGSTMEKLSRAYLHSIRETGRYPEIWAALQDKLKDKAEGLALLEKGYQIYA